MNRRTMLIAAGGALAVGVKGATGSALPAAKPVKGPDSFSLAMEGPQFEILKAVMPKGTVIEPYSIACEKGRMTLWLRPQTHYGTYRDDYMGWITARLPDGLTYIVGFALTGRLIKEVGQLFAELHGREGACKMLREWYVGLPNTVAAELSDGGALPEHGEVKWMR